MRCRLVVVVPFDKVATRQFRGWRSERTSGRTVTLSMGFEDEEYAMGFGHTLVQYVWMVEAATQ